MMNKLFPPRTITVNGKEYHLSIPYILGFFEGDGTTFVTLKPNPSHTLNYQVVLVFSISQHSVDVGLLHAISIYLGIGEVNINQKINKNNKITVIYRFIITKQSDLFKLVNIITPDMMVLRKRAYSFKLLVKALDLVKSQQHTTTEGIAQIQEIAANTTAKMDKETKNLLPATSVKPNVAWVTGFTDAEGHFQCSVFRSKSGSQVIASFSIGQERCELEALYNLVDLFGCGYVTNTKETAKSLPEFKVTNSKDLIGKIIPFFEANKLQTIKYEKFLLWKESILVWKSSDISTHEKYERIISLNNKSKKLR
jgi:hypothetical protein